MRAVGPRGGEAAVPAPSQGWHGDSSGDRRLGQQEPLTGVWCRTGGPGLSGAALSVLWRWGGGGLAAVVGGSTLPGHIVRGPWGSPCPGLLCLPCLPSPPSRAGPRVRRWHRRGRGAAQCRDSSPGSSGFEVMGGGLGEGYFWWRFLKLQCLENLCRVGSRATGGVVLVQLCPTGGCRGNEGGAGPQLPSARWASGRRSGWWDLPGVSRSS